MPSDVGCGTYNSECGPDLPITVSSVGFNTSDLPLHDHRPSTMASARFNLRAAITYILAGKHSAAKTGTVADLGPIPIPRKNREMKRCHQVLVKAPQIQVKNEKRAVTKIVQRLPVLAYRTI